MYRHVALWLAVLLSPLLWLSQRASGVQSESPSALASSAAILPGRHIDLSWFDDAAQSDPALAHDPYLGEFMVVWHSDAPGGNRRLFATQIKASGEISARFVLPGSHDRANPSVAYDPVNHRYLVVWIEDVSDAGTNWDVYGVFVTPTLFAPTIGTPFAINAFDTLQWDPKVVYAPGRDEFFVVWANSYTAGVPPGYISGRRIRADGSFPSARVDLTLADPAKERLHPDLVYNANLEQYLVVWEEVQADRDVYGQLLTASGSLIGAPIGIAGWAGPESHPSVAFCEGAGQYLATWQTLETGGDYDLYGRLISGSGTPGKAGLIQGTAGTRETDPSVACSTNRQSYLVTWTQQYSDRFGPLGVWGRELGRDLSLGPLLVLDAPHQASQARHQRPAIASGGAGFLAVWEHEPEAAAGNRIFGRLLAQDRAYLPALSLEEAR